MAFFRDGEFDTPNPSLQFDAGARVRLVLRNEDPGMTHNFAVPAWGVATRDLESNEVAQIEFVVPENAGRPAYECTPHARMMRGTIEIR
jgi:plastocyanin